MLAQVDCMEISLWKSNSTLATHAEGHLLCIRTKVNTCGSWQVSWYIRWKPGGLTFTSGVLLVAQFGLYDTHDWNSSGQQKSMRKTTSLCCTTTMRNRLMSALPNLYWFECERVARVETLIINLESDQKEINQLKELRIFQDEPLDLQIQ